MILGIDEVGRGPWAGPLVVGAVVLNTAVIDGLTDSKKLSAKQRTILAQHIVESEAAIGLGWVHADELDRIGMSASLIEATKRAVRQIHTPYNEIVIDGTVNFLSGTPLGSYVTTLKKADLLIPAVSAASIVAKVARDEYMSQMDTVFPGYGFTAHAGYGTQKHRDAITELGLTPLHRQSFKPLQSLKKPSTTISTKARGDMGEDVASAWLEKQGCTIVDRNWKTRMCEIDIVAKDTGNTILFVEVKHRQESSRGGGIAAITAKKQRQMLFAARMYLHYHHMDDAHARLAVLTTSGDPSTYESFLLID